MTPVLIRKSLPDELRRIAKVMLAAQIQQFSSRDCELLREAAAEIERFEYALTRPLTLAAVAKVFSDCEHCGSTWTATAFGSIQEDGGNRRLTESEAGDVVRIYLMRGGVL